jgi:hypothetical protein
MPIKAQQLQRLDRDLKVHESTVSNLRKQISLLEEQLAAHEWIIRIGRDEKVLAILNGLADNPESARSMEGRELEVVRSHDIQLPEGATVRITSDSASVTIFLDATDRKFPFTLTWHSAEGFSSGPDPRNF